MSKWAITDAGVIGTDTLGDFFGFAEGQKGLPIAVGKSVDGTSHEVAGYQYFTVDGTGTLVLSGSFTGVANPVGATAASFRGVSRDQSTIVGYANVTLDAGNANPYYYAGGTWTRLANLAGVVNPNLGGTAWAVTPTGDRIVGDTTASDGKNHAVYWDQSSAYAVTDLGLPSSSYLSSVATAVSADGLTIVGQLDNPSGHGSFFRWTSSGGMVDIGVPTGTQNSTQPFVYISGDGNTLATRSVVLATGKSHPYVWTQAGGWVDIGILSGGSIGQASWINADGTIIVGFADDANGVNHAVRWTGSGTSWTIEQLPDLFLGGISQANWANEAGTHIAGVATTSGGAQHAVVWSLLAPGVGVPTLPPAVAPFDPPGVDYLVMVTEATSADPYWIERMTKPFATNGTLPDAWFLDGAVQATWITDQTTQVKVYGLWHLRNQTATAWISGVDCGDFTVANDGTMVVPFAGDFTRARFWQFPSGVVGFTFTSQGQLLRPLLPQDAGAANGPALGKTRRLHMWSALFSNAVGVSVGAAFDKLRSIIFKTPRGVAYPATTLFTGVHQDTLEDDYDLDGMLCWQVTRPYPATISTIGGFIHTQDR